MLWLKNDDDTGEKRDRLRLTRRLSRDILQRTGDIKQAYIVSGAVRDSRTGGIDMAKSALFMDMLDLLKRKNGSSVDEMAAFLGRSERTIYRWLSELETELDKPVECTDGRYYVSAGYATDHMLFTPHELLAAKIALKSKLFKEGSPLRSHAENAWVKLRDASARETVNSTCELADRHHAQVDAYTCQVDSELVEAISRGVEQSLTLNVAYRSQKSNRTKTYKIDPYAMVYRKNAWYVVAYSHQHEDVITMRLERFKSVICTKNTFEVPEDFDLDEHFSDSWEVHTGEKTQKVQVWFSQRVAQMIAETKRHRSQSVVYQPDGSIIMYAEVAGIKEIGRWIMGYGADAKVLEPHSLKIWIADNVREMASMYSEKTEPNDAREACSI